MGGKPWNIHKNQPFYHPFSMVETTACSMFLGSNISVKLFTVRGVAEDASAKVLDAVEIQHEKNHRHAVDFSASSVIF